MIIASTGRVLRSWGSSSLLWHFWAKRIVLARIMPIVGFVLLTYNPWGSWAQWAGRELRGVACAPDPFVAQRHLTFFLVSALLLGGWVYLAGKCWRGVGQSLFKGGILVAVVAVLMYLMLDHGLLPRDSVWMTVAVEAAIGIVLGLAFTFVLIDRQLSGVVTTSTVVEHDVTHTDGGFHHGG